MGRRAEQSSGPEEVVCSRFSRDQDAFDSSFNRVVAARLRMRDATDREQSAFATGKISLALALRSDHIP